MNITLKISDEERQRILNLHESYTKRQHLLKEANGQTKEEYPPCVQAFGNPVKFSNGVYNIKGTGAWAGYNFSPTLFYDPNTKKADNKYFCRDYQIVFGEKKGVTTNTATKVTDSDSNWSVVSDGQKTIGIGARGPLVKALQAILQDDNYGKVSNPEKIGGPGCSRNNPGACDGKFGSATSEAVKAYQKLRGINVDGVMGQQMYQMMFSDAAKPVQAKKPERKLTAVEKNQLTNPNYMNPGKI